MMRLPARHSLLWLFVLLLSPPLTFAQQPDTDIALAQDALKRLSLEELGNVIVTSVSKEPEAVWNTAAAIAVLTREDIARAGVTSVPDALRLIPGVEVARIDTSRNWVVGIRGFGDQYAKSVLVLVDGRSIYTPLWGGVHWPLLTAMLEDIDRIEVIRGPGATIWGANAENGVINIITRSAADTHGTYATVATGNVDRAIGTVRYGGQARGVDYRLWMQGSNRAPQFHSNGQDFDIWRKGEGGGRIDWRGSRDEVTATTDFYVADLGESVRIQTFNPPGSFLDNDPIDVHGASAMGRWRRTLSASSDLTIQGSWDHAYRLSSDFGERRQTFDVDLIHRWSPAARHEIIWGAGARTSPGTIIQTAAFSDFEPHDKTLNLLSVFAQDSVHGFDDRLTLTGGAKVERNTYTGVELQPSARVLWRPAATQTIWGEVTRAVRTPSRVDEDISVALFAAPTTPPLYAVISGNPDLDTESVVGTEVGYRTLVHANLYIDVAAFRNRYANLVDLGRGPIDTRQAEGVTYTAIAFPWVDAIHGTTRGLELAPDWQISNRLRLRGSYSFVTIDLTEDPSGSKTTFAALEGSTPHHQVVLQAVTNPLGRLQVDPVYRYVSSRQGATIPAYHTADLRIAWPFDHGLEVAVAGQNLLQAHHLEWARDPGPAVGIRRAAYVSLTWRH